MIKLGIKFTEGFKKILNNPLRSISLSKFKLDVRKQIWDNIDEKIDLSYILTNFQTSPQDSSNGEAVFYEFDSCIKDSLLTISFGIPDYDVSLGDYDTIYLFYEDILTGEVDLAGLLFGYVENNGIKQSSSLEIEPDRTIINISDFNPKCNILINQNSDLSFLEGPGFGEITNLYKVSPQSNDVRYVSRVSYEAYLQDKRTEDENDHLYTTFINKYGLKIY